MNYKIKKEIIITLAFVIGFILLIGGMYISLPANEKSYIGKNSSNIDFTNYEDYSALEIFDDSVKDKKIVLTNEEIGIKENAQIQYKFISYLMDTWKLKYFLVDIGYAEAAIINEYLQTGDEALLESYNNSSMGYAFIGDSKQEMLKKLYLKNSQLPDNKKLNIMGIGINESFQSVELYFKRIISRNPDLTDKQIENINNILENLKSEEIITNISNDEELEKRNKIILKHIDNFYSDINANEEEYKEALNNDLNNIKIVLDNIKNLQEIMKTYHQDDSNNTNGNEKYSQYLYDNLNSFYKDMNMKRCYIHVYQIYSYQHKILDVDFLGAKIAKDKKFKEKVLGINVIYQKGKFNFDNTQIQINTAREDLNTLLEEIKLDKEDMVIDLNNSRSPYKRKFTPIYFPFPDDILYSQEDVAGEEVGGIIGKKPGVTTDYFQGVIIIKNPSIDETYYNRLYNNQ
ncbi:hypothetical protein IO99_03420 [Clostridium sulfidigenes]|uniref:Uncharacterized protein n=1 Tax=Clostridium sulfidigenes TaxID=318464 RepID=A0A084JGV2_9CLOT|nr:hypothetical protein [Clostridium sulfidigenes]KEZ88186.1 hypothetical protein IO99_03420 [Clostridium sulfidigenes]